MCSTVSLATAFTFRGLERPISLYFARFTAAFRNVPIFFPFLATVRKSALHSRLGNRHPVKNSSTPPQIHYTHSPSLPYLTPHNTSTMARAKTSHTMIKLVSAAKTGYEKWFNIPRSSQRLSLILYDPRAKRHCLFTEEKKRKVPDLVAKDYDRQHR